MANNALAHKEHFDYSGGVNQSVGRLIRPSNETTYIENGELPSIGPVWKVRGFTQRGSTLNSGYEVLGMCSAIKADGTMKQIAICDNASDSDAYTFNPITNVWTPHNLSLTSGSNAEFEYFLDGWFMVNYTEATRWNDFTQWYTTTNVTSAPKGKYIKLYLSRIYIGYCVDGSSTYPSRVIYSDLPDSGTIAWNNSDNYFDVARDDGDVIKGLEVNSNRLLVFKENSLYRYDTNTLYKVPGCPGTVSNRTIQNIQGWTLYLHTSGIWAYNGTSSTLISRKVKDIIDGISTKNLESACAWVKGDHYYLYLNDISNSLMDLEIDNCLLDYDISKNAFTWRSLDVNPTVFNNYRDDRSAADYNNSAISYDDADMKYDGVVSNEQRVYFGTDDGGVYEFDTGKDHNGNPIPFMVETKDYFLDYPAIEKLFNKVHVFVDGGQGVQVSYQIDNKDWDTLGKVDKEQSELLFPSGARGKKIRFRISESSISDRFAFEGLDIYFVPETTYE